MNKRAVFRSGFTLIELSFAIAFISVLLLTVALITNEIVSIYRKGYAIKTINAVGRDLIDDFTASVTDSPPASISSFCENFYASDSRSFKNCKDDGGNLFVYQQYYATIDIVSGSSPKESVVPVTGLFCTGKYSYIWNTGYTMNTNFYRPKGPSPSGDNTTAQFRTKLYLKKPSGTSTGTVTEYAKGASSTEPIRLLKIEDTNRALCAATITDGKEYPDGSSLLLAGSLSSGTSGGEQSITIDYSSSFTPVELLSKTDNDLALYDLVMFDPAQVISTGRLLYTGSFILGTINGGVDIMTSSNFCNAPQNFSADFSYCAINKFNFTIQASGSS